MSHDLDSLFATLEETHRLLRGLQSMMDSRNMRPDPSQLNQVRRVFGRLPNSVLNLTQSLRPAAPPAASEPPADDPLFAFAPPQ